MELYHSDYKAQNQQNKLNIYRLDNDEKIYLSIENENKDAHFLFQTQQLSIFEKDLFSLASYNCIYLTLISFDKAQKSTELFTFTITVNFNIFLSDELKNNRAAEDPTCNFHSSWEIPYKMHNLLNKFSMTKNSFMDSLGHLGDEFEIYWKNQTENRVDNKNENLFDLVHRVHQDEFRNERYDDPEHREVGLIRSHAALRPTLRSYQINAIRWMLKMENFKFESTTSRSKSNTCAVKLENQIPQEIEEENNLHPLYNKLVDKDLNVIYFHKYFGASISKFRHNNFLSI